MRAAGKRDIHVLRYFSSVISVSEGKVINVTDPSLAFCPLAAHLYEGLGNAPGADKEVLKREIGRVIEFKIAEYGFFTSGRRLSHGQTAIPCGASEMLMSALRRRAVDAAVMVCDGAGTVITDRAEIAQGIGARMHTLLLTSPIRETMERLKESGCEVVFDNALIDQVRGVRRAIEAGHQNIAVTISGHDSGKLEEIRRLESCGGAAVTVFVVCTTGLKEEEIGAIRRHADIVWSCASRDIRRQIGAVALLQISRQIPVFALTRRGIEAAASCADDPSSLLGLDAGRQYLLSRDPGGRRIRWSGDDYFLRQDDLPALSRKNFIMAGA